MLLAALIAARCATSRVSARDAFPLDPREELPGPFPAAVDRGWVALASGDAPRAAAEFAVARASGGGRAADIGLIEAQVLSGNTAEGVAGCVEALEAADATVPLLVACGEAAADDGRPLDGYALYRQALARRGARAGLYLRSRALQRLAADVTIAGARAAASEERAEDARRLIGDAVALMPESAALRVDAAEVELQLGDRRRALARYREALEIDPGNAPAAEKGGAIALETGDEALAAALFDGLAKTDPSYRPRADEARIAFRVANWPEPERKAAHSTKLTRAGAAALVWWMVPEVREATVTAGVIASDAVSRRDSRALTRVLALGLLETDRETHRASPDGLLTVSAAAQLLARLFVLLEQRADRIPCWMGSAKPPRTAAEAVQVARNCELIEGKETAAVSGPDFVRALDRLRALVS